MNPQLIGNITVNNKTGGSLPDHTFVQLHPHNCFNLVHKRGRTQPNRIMRQKVQKNKIYSINIKYTFNYHLYFLTYIKDLTLTATQGNRNDGDQTEYFI